MIRRLILLAALAITTAGCSIPDPDGAGAEIVNPGGVATQVAPGGDAPGTRGNPVPAGTTVRVGDWEVSLGPTDTDAAAEIAAGSVLEQAPPPGHRLVLVTVNVTYVGTDSGNPLFNLSITFLGSAGNTFGATDNGGPYVTPTPLSRVGEMFPGAAGAGGVAVSAPEGQVGGGAWIVESGATGRTFFALA
jgi:hypothetical protein